jgi:hypothetical protein
MEAIRRKWTRSVSSAEVNKQTKRQTNVHRRWHNNDVSK